MSQNTLRERLDVVLTQSAYLGPSEQAGDAIRCLLTWLSDRKLRVVPEDVSDAMNLAACHVRWRGKPEAPAWVLLADARVDASLFWDMWAAAQKAAPSNHDALTGKDDQ